MQEVARIALRVARSNANVLLLGESGTGKRFVARVIRQLSAPSAGPSAQVHCGSARDGRFDSEKGGTLILLDVELLPAALQAELLERLQRDEPDFYAAGGGIRVLATSTRDLWTEVREGRFREDRGYRSQRRADPPPPLRARTGGYLTALRSFSAKLQHAEKRRQ